MEYCKVFVFLPTLMYSITQDSKDIPPQSQAQKPPNYYATGEGQIVMCNGFLKHHDNCSSFLTPSGRSLSILNQMINYHWYIYSIPWVRLYWQKILANELKERH